MDFLPENFKALGSVSQFIIYKVIPSASRPGKTDKIPLDYRTGQHISPFDSSAWLDADYAIAVAKNFGAGHGVGFVLTENDPFFCIDVDGCVDIETGAWSPIAIQLLTEFAGAGVELSNSWCGIHIFGTGVAPAHGTQCKALGLEFYTEKRFIALTGLQPVGDAGADFTHKLSWLVDSYFPRSSATVYAQQGLPGVGIWRAEPVESWRGPTDDDELIKMMLNSKSARSALGVSASLDDLWHARIDILSKFYPDKTAAYAYDRSHADIALAQHLTFWTGNNSERIERLMRKSALQREKWDARPEYLRQWIIGPATARATKFLQSKSVPAAIGAAQEVAQGAGVTLITSSGFLNAEQQVQLFKGCTYVLDEHAVLVPGGDLIDAQRFRVKFGGYTFVMDASNARTVRNAFEAFTESQVCKYPFAHSTCFKPNLPPGTIIDTNERVLVNTWWPLKTPRYAGDPTPFINHLAYLLPIQRDRDILLSYMAACIQHQGVKFQWCPIVQGVEGNGKTLLISCVEFAIGTRYCQRPIPEYIAEKHNDFLYRTIFIGLDDIYYAEGNKDIIDALKPMITNTFYGVEPKFKKKQTVEICCNFMITTNYKDGLRKTRNDRRFAPFFTAQQDREEPAWSETRRRVQGFYSWLKNESGYEITSEFLHTYPIPDEFNPRDGQEAPRTSSTESAITAGLGGIEQEIQEAIEQEQLGFRGGWISSIHLNNLLTRLHVNRRIPFNRRRDLLRSLGYDWHPAFKEARVNNPVIVDGGGKPRLFIRTEHPALTLNSSAAVNAYVAAQSIET